MSCLVKPENHQLWDELFEYLGQGNRELVKYWYNVAHDQEFLELVGDQLEMNSEGEPTFASLMRAAGTTEYKEQVKQKLNEQIGAGKMSYNEAIERLQSFNRSTPFKQEYMATITPIEGGKVELSVVEKTTANQQKLHKFISQKSLQERIKYYLNKNGVDYSFMEEGGEVEGRYSTENVEQTEQGLSALITLSNGGKVTAVLAEEAGHFAVGAMGDSPLVTRLQSLLNPEVQMDILGDEYRTRNLGKNPSREVAGYLVGQAMLNNVDQNTAFGRLAQRIADVAKKIFAKITHNDVLAAKTEAKEIATKIARSFMSEDFDGSLENALATPETLYDRQKSNAELLFSNISYKLREIQKQLRAYYPERAKTVGAILDDMELGRDWTDKFAQVSAMEGIAQALLSLADEAKNIQDIFMSIDGDFNDDIKFWENFYSNGKSIRYCDDYCRAALEIIHLFEGSGLKGDLNVQMYDRNGKVLFHNIKDLSDNLRTLITGGIIKHVQSDGSPQYVDCEGLFSDVRTKGVDFFTKFCEETLGRKYIIRAQRVLLKGKNPFSLIRKRAEKVDIRQMIDSIEEDTSWFGKMFGSMGNSSDVISQIVFKAYKAARQEADNDTNRVWDELRRLNLEMKETAGISNPRYFCEVSEVDSSSQEKDFVENLLGINTADPNQYKDGVIKIPIDKNLLGEVTVRTEDISEALKKGGKIVIRQGGRCIEIDESKLPSRWAEVAYVKLTRDSITRAYSEVELDKVPNEGSLTGNVLTLYQEGRYEWEYKQFKKYMIAKFKAENLNWQSWSDQKFGSKWQTSFAPERKKFFKNTHQRTDSGWVLNDSYVSKQYAEKILHVNTKSAGWEYQAKMTHELGSSDASQKSAERRILDRWLEIKQALDDKLPAGSCPNYRMPQFRGDFLDRWKNKRSTGDNFMVAGMKVGLNYLHEEFSGDSIEGDYGSDQTYNLEEDQMLANPYCLADETINRIPLYGINKLEDMSRISTDIFGSLLSYANMANSYNAMDFVSHAMEIGKHVIGGYRVMLDNNGDVIEIPKQGSIRKFLDKIGLSSRRVTKASDWRDRSRKGITSNQWAERTGSHFNVYDRYTKFLDKQLYGNPFAGRFVPGDVLKKTSLIKIAKALGFLTGISAAAALGGSITVAGLSLLDGINEIVKESHSGENFNKRDLAWAHMAFFKYMAPNWATYLGVRFTKTKFRADKLSLLLRKFNIDEANSKRFTSWNTKRRLGLKKLFNDALFLPMEAGTMYMNTVPYIALMRKAKVYDKYGKSKSLWDAYRVSGDTDTGLGMTGNRTIKLSGDYFSSEDKAHQFSSLSNALKQLQDFMDGTEGMTDDEFLAHTDANETFVRNILEEELNGVSTMGYFTERGTQLEDATGKLMLSRKDMNKLLHRIKVQMDDLRFGSQDEANFMAKARQMVNNMHGIYDRDNKGVINQTIAGQAWATMKGYAFGMISKTWSSNRYNIFNERDTDRIFTDEDGTAYPMLDGEMEGFMNTTWKLIVNAFGHPGSWGKNIATTISAAMFATVGFNPNQIGTKELQSIGFDAGAFSNVRRMAASILASIGMSLLIGALTGDDDDEDDTLEDGNPWKKIKRGGIRDKAVKAALDDLELAWENGIVQETNFAQLFYEHPEVFATDEGGKEAWELMGKLASLHSNGKNRSKADQNIDYKGLAVYFLTRMKRDNDAFIDVTGLWREDASSRQEIQGFSSLVKSTISFSMLGQFGTIARELYGDWKYGDLHNAQVNYIDGYNRFVKDCRKQGVKPPKSLNEFTDIMISYYEANNGAILLPQFEEHSSFISFLAENKKEYPTVKDMNTKLFNEYYYANSSRGDFYKKGDAKWRRHLETITPWVKASRLLYNPEETLDSYMFAVRNQ